MQRNKNFGLGESGGGKNNAQNHSSVAPNMLYRADTVIK
jgi:hypothetical protein